MFFRHADDGLHMVVGQRIINGLSGAAALDQLCLLDDAQLMGNGRLADSENFCNVTDADLRLKEYIKDLDQRGIPKYLEELRPIQQFILRRHMPDNLLHKLIMRTLHVTALVIILIDHFITNFHMFICSYINDNTFSAVVNQNMLRQRKKRCV